MSKRFALSERFSPFFNVEYFNRFSHPMVGSPAANFKNYLSSPTFGEIIATQNDALEGLAALSDWGGRRPASSHSN